MSIDKGMVKEDVVYIYKMEYYLALKREKIQIYAMIWMNLEDITLSETSQFKQIQ